MGKVIAPSLLLLLLMVGLACSTFNGTDQGSAAGEVQDGGTRDGTVGPVTGTAAEHSVVIAPLETLVVTRGRSAPVTIKLTRGGHLANAFKVRVTGFPSAITAEPATGNGESFALTILVDAAQAQGPATGTIELTIPHDDDGESTVATVPLSLFIRGKSGELDTTFGNGGVASAIFPAGSTPGLPADLLVGPDDSLYLIAGDFRTGGTAGSTIHLDPQGKVDLKYGTGGFATTFATPLSGALQTDGKLILVGRGPSGGVVARLNADGKPDTNFGPQSAGAGANNVTTGGLSGTNGGNVGVAVRYDGEILVAFDGSDGATKYAGQLRFAPDGSLRTTYGTGGGVRAIDGLSLAMFIRNDPGSISKGSVVHVAAGPQNSVISYLQRTVDNGSDPDPNVTSASRTSTAAYPLQRLAGSDVGAAVLADGASVVPISYFDVGAGTVGFLLRKFSATGDVPAGYGTAGASMAFTNSYATSIALAPDESTLVSCVGSSDLSPAGVYRINKDGSQDTNWNIARIDAPAGFVGPIRYYERVVVEKVGRVVTAFYLYPSGGATMETAGLASFWL